MDYPYIVNYLMMLILAFLYWKTPKSKYIKWAFIIQFIFIAFRAPVVGADTWNYIRYMTGERNFYNYDPRPLEIGFVLYRDLLLNLKGSRFVYMVINTIIICFPLYYIFKNYSKNVPLSMAMLSVFQLYATWFCALRQLIGLSILYCCLLYVINKTKYKWIIAIIGTALAYTFHTSTILYASIFFCTYCIHIKNRKIILLIIILSALIGIVLQSLNILQIFNLILGIQFDAIERIDLYLQNENLNDISSLSISLRLTLISLFIFLFMDKVKLDHWFSKIFLVGVIISNLFITVPMIHRITMGMMIFGPVVFTWIFSNAYYTNKKTMKWINILMIIFFIYFTRSIIINNLNSTIDPYSSERMHPYYFIWEDYKDHPSIKYF
ncbi:EpsG family protein [Phocaeicola barnesiae]|uniref:EpsG family protein n=1 Tax=Phocaeicola barnesiae TaxID=376804 RepID=UPI0025A43D44|nr:EpsG family protein [Phocaeicola barnesiae]MDM8310362.1 EpsG family protein [Phocaeicola barnesiae]